MGRGGFRARGSGRLSLAIFPAGWYTTNTNRPYSRQKERSRLDSILAWFRQLQFDGVLETLLLVAASLLCITVHETCHGLAAWWQGTPRRKTPAASP